MHFQDRIPKSCDIIRLDNKLTAARNQIVQTCRKILSGPKHDLQIRISTFDVSAIVFPIL